MDWFYEHAGQSVGPVSRAEILRLILKREIRPETMVWTASFGNEWRQASQAGLVSPLTGLVRPGEGIANHWAWVAILAPIGVACSVVAILMIRHVPHDQWKGPENAARLLALCVFFIAFVLDRRMLREASIEPPGFWWWLFLPGYLWVRMQRTAKGRGLFAVSMAIFFFSLGFQITEAIKLHPAFQSSASLSVGNSETSSSSDRTDI